MKQEKVNCLHFEKIVGVALRVGNIRHLRVFVVLSKPSWAEIVKGVNNEVRYAQTWVMNDVHVHVLCKTYTSYTNALNLRTESKL